MKCCCCNLEKPEYDFSFKNKKERKFNSRCKSCQSEYCKTHYLNNKEKHILSSCRSKKAIRSKNQKLKLEYLSGKSCAECGNTDQRVFEFHHRNPLEKENTVSVLLNFKSWDKVIKEIEKCDILCANCHRIKHYKNP